MSMEFSDDDDPLNTVTPNFPPSHQQDSSLTTQPLYYIPQFTPQDRPILNYTKRKTQKQYMIKNYRLTTSIYVSNVFYKSKTCVQTWQAHVCGPHITLECETTFAVPETFSPCPSAYSQSWTHSNSADASDQTNSSPGPRDSKPHSPYAKSVRKKSL
jgi:hypothetical protein